MKTEKYLVQVEALDFGKYNPATDLEHLGLDRLDGALVVSNVCKLHAFQIHWAAGMPIMVCFLVETELPRRKEQFDCFHLRAWIERNKPPKVRAKDFKVEKRLFHSFAETRV